MRKFKVGDKVVRAVCCSTDEDFLNMLGEAAYYTVTSVHPGGCWLQVNGVSRRYDKHPWSRINFEPYQEPDDELPPAPTSVSYLEDGGQRKLQAQISGDSVHLLLSLRKVSALGYSLDPDPALQLAHDLRRMAMDIKRKEKAQ